MIRNTLLPAFIIVGLIYCLVMLLLRKPKKDPNRPLAIPRPPCAPDEMVLDPHLAAEIAQARIDALAEIREIERAAGLVPASSLAPVLPKPCLSVSDQSRYGRANNPAEPHDINGKPVYDLIGNGQARLCYCHYPGNTKTVRPTKEEDIAVDVRIERDEETGAEYWYLDDDRNGDDIVHHTEEISDFIYIDWDEDSTFAVGVEFLCPPTEAMWEQLRAAHPGITKWMLAGADRGADRTTTRTDQSTYQPLRSVSRTAPGKRAFRSSE